MFVFILATFIAIRTLMGLRDERGTENEHKSCLLLAEWQTRRCLEWHLSMASRSMLTTAVLVIGALNQCASSLIQSRVCVLYRSVISGPPCRVIVGHVCTRVYVYWLRNVCVCGYVRVNGCEGCASVNGCLCGCEYCWVSGWVRLRVCMWLCVCGNG